MSAHVLVSSRGLAACRSTLINQHSCRTLSQDHGGDAAHISTRCPGPHCRLQVHPMHLWQVRKCEHAAH